MSRCESLLLFLYQLGGKLNVMHDYQKITLRHDIQGTHTHTGTHTVTHSLACAIETSFRALCRASQISENRAQIALFTTIKIRICIYIYTIYMYVYI